MRARLRALPGVVRPDDLLSRHWDRRVAAAAAGDAPGTVVPLGAYAPDFRRGLGPGARAFGYGEWCPPYLLGLLAEVLGVVTGSTAP